MVGGGKKLASVPRRLDVRNKEGASGLEEGREDARCVRNRGEVVIRRAALQRKESYISYSILQDRASTTKRLTTMMSNLSPSSSPGSPLSSVQTARISSGARPWFDACVL